jgi:hypothetical protein
MGLNFSSFFLKSEKECLFSSSVILLMLLTVLLSSIRSLNTFFSSCIFANSRTFFNPKGPYSRIQQVPIAFQPHYNEILKDISKINNNRALFEGTKLKPSLRDVEHIFDLQFRLDKTGQLKKVHGFHHDYMRAFERSGLIEVLEEKAGIDGCYELKFRVNGVEDTKTFFPAHWTREKVIEKIIEAYESSTVIDIGIDGTKVIRGKTLEGVEIEIRVSPDGRLHSVFPKISDGI